MKPAILTDTTRCIGCRECVAACKKANGTGADLPRKWDRSDGLSARNWTAIVDGPKGAYVRKQCRHCLEPACASACPVGALHKTALGPVVYDSSKCLGCRYCMMACPFGIPRYAWDQPVPYVRKCNMCYERLQAGLKPACTTACPVNATIFGDRDELLAEAHRRIDAGPGNYVNRVWGEHEVGGTSVLYVSNVDLSFLTDGEHLGASALPATTKAAMEAVPVVFPAVLGLMAGMKWFFDRREKVAAVEAPPLEKKP